MPPNAPRNCVSGPDPKRRQRTLSYPLASVIHELPLANQGVPSRSAAGERGSASVNLVVLQGLVRDDPVARSLSSGQQVMSFELAVRSVDETLESVPIVLFDSACVVVPDDEVVVIGRVRKRFFRTGGATQSRTEVVATRVVPARRRAQVAKALDQAMAQARRWRRRPCWRRWSRRRWL